MNRVLGNKTSLKNGSVVYRLSNLIVVILAGTYG